MFLSVLCCLIVVAPSAAMRATVMEIQGRGHRSPLAAADVVTEGVVTALALQGFWLQDAPGDGDPTTSDAIRVAAGEPPVRPGDLVAVEGSVVERATDDEELSVTAIDASRVTVLARGRALPPAVVIGAGGRVPPASVIDDDALSIYQPLLDGIDFYESLEGMRVTIEAARAVGPPDNFGHAWVVPMGATTGSNLRGGITARPLDSNPERIRVQNALAATGSRTIASGTDLGNLNGILDYALGSFALIPDPIDAAPGAPPAEESSTLAGDETHLLVATLNARNFQPGEPRRTRRLAEIIVTKLGAPDVLAMQEIQDDSGSDDDGTVSADSTFRVLVDAVQAAGGPLYRARDIPPVDGADGGEPGGNIRTAFLFRPDRVTFVERAGASLETRAAVDADGVRLTRNPGLVAPGNPAWIDSRKPLAAEFVFAGHRVFMIAVHFRSKSGSTPAFGAVQPPVSAGAAARVAQARAVKAFVDDLRRLDGDARVVVLGDFNDDWFAQPPAILEEGRTVVNLARLLPELERYTYLFEGNGHAYDHIFVTPSLATGARLDVVHTNAEFADNITDHDPVVARLAIVAPAGDEPGARGPLAYPNPSADEVTLRVGEGRREVLIVDARGARVRRLVSADKVVVWDGLDERGRRVASGVYFARVAGTVGTRTHRIVRVR